MSPSRHAPTPLFVVGYPRSGTTLLLHILLSTGCFPSYDFSETHFYSHYFRRFGSLKKGKNREAFVEALAEADFVREAPLDWHLFRRRWLAGDSTTYGSLLRDFMDELASQQNKSWWVEKTPWHGLYLDQISHDFPDARFVHIVRDPRDVALSVIGWGWTGESRLALAGIGASWRHHVRIIEQFLRRRPEKGVTLRYEDVVRDLDSACGSLSSLLGAPLNPEAILAQGRGVLGRPNTSHHTVLGGMNTASVGRWNEVEISFAPLELIAGDAMAYFGYDVELGAAARMAAIPLRAFYRGYRWLRSVLFPLVRR